MTALPATIYHGTTRQQRRELAKELAALEDVERRLMASPKTSGLRSNRGRFLLMAHPPCGRVPGECTCRDANGKPLDWGLGTVG